ncbi:MAG: hypothetical protein H0W73_12290 [Bacteroidetes bacterium]|nr:hypothetical protein [Bacteroidota bacterium]
MRKKFIFATSALAITAGSIFAMSNQGAEKAIAKTATEQCPPDCCNGKGGNCEPGNCDKGNAECCDK